MASAEADISKRRVRSLAMRLLGVTALGYLLGVTINSDHKIEVTMVTLLTLFVVPVAYSILARKAHVDAHGIETAASGDAAMEPQAAH